MQNLIENAVKYGNGGYLGIKSEDEEDCRLITVCNSGEGPGDDEMLHIFDSFYRGSNSSNVNGSGMGLYICRKIIHMMDGEIFAENKDGCFNVTVVLKKVWQKLHFLLFKDYLIINNVFLSHKTGKNKKYV